MQELTASDGTRLRYRVWPAPERRATVVLLNGIMSNSAWFEPLAPRLVAARIHIVGADRRGSGHNAEGWGDAPSAGQLVQDVLAIVEAEIGDEPLVLVGWCWGAALAVLAAAKLGERVHAVVLVTPGFFPTLEVMDALKAQDDAEIIQTPIREDMFTTGTALEEFIRRDEHRVVTMTPRLRKVSGLLATAALVRLRKLAAPVRVILATDDEATDNDKTIAALPGSVEITTLKGPHGLQFDAPRELAQCIIEAI